MLKHCWIIALRTFRKSRTFSIVNILGLGLGMAAFVLIMLWVADELSYDRYHSRADRIYRVAMDFQAGRPVSWPMTMPNLGPLLQKDFPEIENMVRIDRPRPILVSYEDKRYQEDLIGFMDGSLFEIFDYQLLQGDPESVLSRPYSVVLTESMAGKIFGTQDPLGKMIRIGGDFEYTVTGLMKDVPSNSHFRFDAACSFETHFARDRQSMENWFHIQFYTYLLLDPNSDPAALEAKLPDFVDRYLGEALRSFGGSMRLFLQPLKKIHLHSHLLGEMAPQGNMTDVTLFTGIALFVLIIACINFVNLSTARSLTRAKEVGIRKTLGAGRSGLAGQFLGESVMFGLLGMLLGVLLLALSQPLFQSLIGRPLGDHVTGSFWLWPGFLVTALLVGLAAGAYPALSLSSFRPVHGLRGQFTGSGKAKFRSVLVVIQFAISIALIIGTLTVDRQVRYMKDKELGFDQHILAVPLPRDVLQKRSLAAIRQELLLIPGVLNVGASSLVPMRGSQKGIFLPEGYSDQPQTFNRLHVDVDFLSALNIGTVLGRGFEEEQSDRNNIVINQETARFLGWDDPIGKTIQYPANSGPENNRKIIGVVGDFHFMPMQQKIEPLVFLLDPQSVNNLCLKLEAGFVSETLDRLKKTWETIDPTRPFSFYFLDESIEQLYRNEERMEKIVVLFSILAISIACLGLFAVASFVVERRTKEIGIRKVLGASQQNVIAILIRDFMIWVAMANVMAWPAGYYLMNKWLENFAYRLPLAWWIFILGGSTTLMVALFTIVLQAVKAGKRNPVDTLRYE